MTAQTRPEALCTMQRMRYPPGQLGERGQGMGSNEALWTVLPVLTIMALAAGSGCASAPQTNADDEALVASATTVYFHPSRGQSAQQQDRDRYECHNWAVRQSGFDPSAPQVPPHLRVVSTPSTSVEAGVAVGAASGALVGAAVSRPWESGSGALLGTLAGAAIGGITASAATDSAQNQERRMRAARLEQQASDYRRALSACLEARGYIVSSNG